MATDIYYYRVWCVTDSKWEYVWNTVEPTVCPNNSADTIDSTKTAILQTVSENSVKVSEKNVNTAGYLCDKGWNWAIPATTGDHIFTISLPFPLDILSAKFLLVGAEKQDTITAVVSPDTVVGFVDNVAGYAIGDKIISVDPTVTGAAVVGRTVKFGTDTTEYWVTSRDLTANTITIWPKDGTDTGLVAAVIDNDIVKLNVYLADKSNVPSSAAFLIGEDKLGGSFLPSNTTVQITLNNSTATAKHLHMNAEFLYGDA